MAGGVKLIIIALSVVFVKSQDVYLVDNSKDMGRRFEGIGGLSGGGVSMVVTVIHPKTGLVFFTQ